MLRRVVFLVTGLQAAGKSTVGPLLTARMRPPAASFDGDVLHGMVKIGREVMTPLPSEEALRQLRARYEGAALLAQHYVDHGFDFVYNDIVLGSYVAEWMDSVRDAERHLIVLAPSIDTLVNRELGRGGGNSYRDWQQSGDSLADAVRSMSRALDETPRRGLWIDTSDQNADEVVESILADDMHSSLY